MPIFLYINLFILGVSDKIIYQAVYANAVGNILMHFLQLIFFHLRKDLGYAWERVVH